MIQVLDRAFEVLEYLASNDGKMAGLSQIEAACGIQKTTLSNILKTMERAGYVAHPQKRGGYRLGYKFYLLAGPNYVFKKIEQISAEEMKRLYDIFSETVVLAGEQNGKRVILKVMECTEGITARISHSSDIYQSATGRVILANYPESRVRNIVAAVGLPLSGNWSGMGSEDDLLRGLAQIRADGYSVSSDHPDVKGIAVPILLGRNPVASIGICLPKFRCTASKIALIKEVLDECATSMEKKMFEADFME